MAERHTLSQDEIIGVNEVVEGVLGQGGDIGVGRDHCGQGGQQGSSEALLLHGEGCDGGIKRVSGSGKEKSGDARWKIQLQEDG